MSTLSSVDSGRDSVPDATTSLLEKSPSSAAASTGLHARESTVASNGIINRLTRAIPCCASLCEISLDGEDSGGDPSSDEAIVRTFFPKRLLLYMVIGATCGIIIGMILVCICLFLLSSFVYHVSQTVCYLFVCSAKFSRHSSNQDHRPMS